MGNWNTGIFVITMLLFVGISAQVFVPVRNMPITLGSFRELKEVAAKHRAPIRLLLKAVVLPLMKDAGITDQFLADIYQKYFLKYYGTPYGLFLREIKAIAKGGNITVDHAFAMQIFYEMSAKCTALLARSNDGVLLAHNLDFVDAEYFRPLYVSLLYTNKNRDHVYYNTSGILGSIGVLMGIKPGKFSIMINERCDFPNLHRFVKNLKDLRVPTMWVIRYALGAANSFDEAVKILSETKTVSGSYLSVGGNKPNQGVVLTKDADKVLHIDSLKQKEFIVQCNSDWNGKDYDPTFRSSNATLFMGKLMDRVHENITLNDMFTDVLKQYPVLRNGSEGAGTISSVLIGPNSGAIESFVYYPMTAGGQTQTHPDVQAHNNSYQLRQ